MFKRKGGGGKGLLNNVKRNCTFLTGRLPLYGALSGQHCCKLQITVSGAHLDFVAGVVQGEGGLVDIQSIPSIFDSVYQG